MRAFVVMDRKDGKIVGLEVLDASSLLHAGLLAQANEWTAARQDPAHQKPRVRRTSNGADPSQINWS